MGNNVIKRLWNKNTLTTIEDLRGMTFQAEEAGHTFEIRGVDGDGNTIALSGTPAGVMLRPDNTDVALDCAVSEGVVTATLPAECYDVPGRFGLTVYLTSDGQKTAIYAAIGSVSRTSSGNVSPATTASVVDLINAIEEAIEQIPASDTNLKAALAPTYSTSAVYPVGSYAWYNGKLYKCIVAITSGETWTSAHWTEAKLANDVCDLKSAIDKNFEEDYVKIPFKILSNPVSAVDGSIGSSTSSSHTDYIDITKFSSIKYKRRGTVNSSSTAGLAFYNSSKSFIPNSGIRDVTSQAQTGYLSDLRLVTPPSGAVYVMFTTFTNTSTYGEFEVYGLSCIASDVIKEKHDSNNLNNVLKFENSTEIAWFKEQDSGVKYDDGTTVESNSFSATNYIDVRAFDTITYKQLVIGSSTINTGMAFYDQDKVFVEGSGVPNISGSGRGIRDNTVAVPDGACYVRCTIFRDDQGFTFAISGHSRISALNDVPERVDAIEAEIGNIKKSITSDVDSERISIPFDVVPGYSVDSTNGNLIESNTYNCTDFIDIRGLYKIECKRITVPSEGNLFNGLAFFDENKNYLYGISSKWNSVSGYEDGAYAFPSDVAYVRCTIRKDTATHGEYEVFGYKRIHNTADTYIEPYFNMENIGNVNAYSGADVSSEAFCRSNYIFCHGFDYVRFGQYVSVSAQQRFGFAFYDENKVSINVGAGMFNSDVGGFVHRVISIPQTAYYMRYAYLMQDYIVEHILPDPYIRLYMANSISQRVGRSDGQAQAFGNLYFRKPKSKGIENAIRRMHQLSNLKFTPVQNFTKLMHDVNGEYTRSVYLAGIEYTGLPYSPTYLSRNTINAEKSIDVFMSAVANDKSKMYDTSSSNWTKHCYYGSVCSGFVFGSMGLKYYNLTKDMPNFPWFTQIAPAGAYNEQVVELGDILLSPSHGAAVSGLLCDNTGKVKLIEVSQESLGGYIATAKANSRWFTPENFHEKFSGFALLRYKYIDEVEYCESDYSQVFPEGVSCGQPKRYIYSVFGDKGLFKASSVTALEIAVSDDAYSAGGRTVNVYCNGELVQTESITSETSSISVNRQNVGRYFLSLVNASDEFIDSTEFEAIDGTFTTSITNNVVTLTYDTASNVYAIEYKIAGDIAEKFYPLKDISGTGSIQVELPANSSIVGVVLGNRNGSIHVST